MAAINHFGAFPFAGFNGVEDDDGQSLANYLPYRERPEYWIDTFQQEREYLGEVPDNILEDVYLKLTFKEAVQLFWTVKKWNISFSFDRYEDTSDDGDFEKEVSFEAIDFSVDHPFAQKTLFNQPEPLLEKEIDLFSGAGRYGSFLLPSNSSYMCDVFVTDKAIRKSDGLVMDVSEVKTIGTLNINNAYFALGFSIDFFLGQYEGSSYYFNACRNDEFVFYPWKLLFETSVSFLYATRDEEGDPRNFYGVLSSVGSIAYLDGAIPTNNYVRLYLPSGKIISKRLYDATQNYNIYSLGPTSFFCPPFNNDIVIKPSEYFEYDAEDGGGPIYDKVPNSGDYSIKKLRDPISLKKL
jgi:hypothetical protein